MRLKKTRLLLLVSLIALMLLPQNILATDMSNSSSGPLNPEFLSYQDQQTTGEIGTASIDGHSTGHIPAPVERVEIPDSESIESNASLPSSFDLRTTGRVTEVRNQGDWGSCWAFASLGSLESYLKAFATVDLSENNLMWNNGFDGDPNDGGNAEMATAYLARWSGPISEAADPYNSSKTTGLSPIYHVQEVQYLPDSQSAIKESLMSGGAVGTSIYSTAMDYNTYYNDSTNALYYTGNEQTDHDVLIVGWDDNYSRYNFSQTPQGDGAWIIKNSWGSNWGDNGYFYLSYYDSYAGENATAFHNAEATSNYSRIYQYDPLGNTSTRGYNNGDHSSWGANIFTAAASESLTAISTYALSPNTTADIYIYTNPNSSNPSSGDLQSSQQVTFDYSGYYTVTLNTPVSLTANETFSVVIKYVTPYQEYPIPMESQQYYYSSGARAYSGESFISAQGSNWQDTGSAYGENVCIKAFTSEQTTILQSITITQAPDKQVYKIGESLDLSGLIVTGTYSDGSTHTETITNANISGFDSTTAGTKTITVNVNGKIATFNVRIENPGDSSNPNLNVYYRTHVQNIGWQDTCSNGEISGTSGLGYRLEAIQIQLGQSDYDVGIAYRTHVQNIGWQGSCFDGEMSGTSGLGYRLEAIQIQLYGDDAELFDVYYRVHCQNIGWMDWAVNGDMAGTSGYGYRLEAIQIEVVPKDTYFSLNSSDIPAFLEIT